MGRKSKSRKEPLTKRQKVLIAAVSGFIVASIAVGIGSYILLNQSSPQTEQQKAEDRVADEIARKIESDGRLQDQAKKELEQSDNPQAVRQVYQQAIDSSTEINRKIELYVGLANVYYDGGKTEEAFNAALEAIDLSSDKFLAADWLSRAYDDQKNYPEAIKYYTIARDSVGSVQNDYRLEKSHYDEKIRVATQKMEAAR